MGYGGLTHEICTLFGNENGQPMYKFVKQYINEMVRLYTSHVSIILD